MQLRFIHAADIHLGYEQYNLVQRADDFARAYLALVDYAIEAQADYVLLAGDLFHRASADAWMLKQATYGLERLRRARIPVLAVEGNHDAQNVHQQLSWLEFLCDQDLLCLLNVHSEKGYRSLVPFDEESRRGSYIDVAGARVYGMKYHGAATARRLEEIQDQIEPGPDGYTILMLHAGLEGQVPHLHGGLTRGQIEPLRERVDYLALGHIHKRLMDEWIFNPGSTETNSMEEMDWPHGFFDVQVDTSLPEKHRVKEIATSTLRPFHRISVSAEGIGSLDDFVAHAEEEIAARKNVPQKAVVELYLGGVAEFRRQDVPIERLKSAVDLRFSPLVTRIRNTLVPPGVVSVRNEERMSRADLERQVVEHLVYQQAEYRDRAASWARLILDVKNMAAEKTLPATIADHVRASLAGIGASASEEKTEEEIEIELPANQSPPVGMEGNGSVSSPRSEHRNPEDTAAPLPAALPERASPSPASREERTEPPARERANGSKPQPVVDRAPAAFDVPLSFGAEPLDSDFELEESW